MSYTITLTSDIQNVALNTVQLVIVFTVNTSGSNQSYTFEEKGIKLLESGRLKWAYDIEDFFMTPSTYTLTLGDMLGYLDRLFFNGTTEGENTDKRPSVRLKINGNTVFLGSVSEDGVNYSESKKEVKLEVSPNTDIINKKLVYYEDIYNFTITELVTVAPQVGDLYSNNYIMFEVYQVNITATCSEIVFLRKPGYTGEPVSSGTLGRDTGSGDVTIYFGSYVKQAINPFAYTYNSSKRIVSILEDIFKLVNNSIGYPTTLKVLHDWKFQGVRNVNNVYLNDIDFSELYQLVNPLFWDGASQIKTCGDILKKLAIDWCAFTGMISDDKAFFKKLFYYDATNTQTVDVLDREKAYKTSLVDYVKVTTNIGISDPAEPYKEGIFTQVEDRGLERESLPGYFLNNYNGGTNVASLINRTGYFAFYYGGTIPNYPAEGAIYSNNSSLFQVIGTPFGYTGYTTTERVATKRISGTNNPLSSGTLTRVSGAGPDTISYVSFGDVNVSSPNKYNIYKVRDVDLFGSTFYNHAQLEAKFWYYYRGNLQRCRIDKFTLKGINYDFLKDFNYDDCKYQPVSMEINLAKNQTICEAIYLGEL